MNLNLHLLILSGRSIIVFLNIYEGQRLYMDSKFKVLKISYDQLNSETLHGVMEEFVTHDGTDYGEVEVSLDTKI